MFRTDASKRFQAPSAARAKKKKQKKRKKERYERSILIFDKIDSRFEIGGNHLLHQVIEGNFAFPSKNFLGFSRITEQETKQREGSEN